MNRRELLRNIVAGAPALALATVTPAFAVSAKLPDGDFMFHGWRVHWGGWQRVINMNVRAGYWIGYGAPSDQWHLYSAWPGNCGPFVSGAVMDISKHPDQTIPTYLETDEEMDHYKSECLERLKRLIVKVGPPPYPMDDIREGRLKL